MADDSLSHRYKQAELEYDRRIGRDGCYIGFRLDGRAFHTLTSLYEKPFDNRIIEAMLSACRSVFDSLNGFDLVCAYVASDEISAIAWLPKGSVESGTIPFNGRLDKITACAASYASLYFDRSMVANGADFYARGNESRWLPASSPVPRRGSSVMPTFDCRAFTLRDVDDIERYLSWRRMDCMRNAVSAASTVLFGHMATLNKTTDERRAMLIGTPYETIDGRAYRGTIMRTVQRDVETEYIDARDGKVKHVNASRTFIEAMDGTRENAAAVIREFDSTKRDAAD